MENKMKGNENSSVSAEENMSLGSGEKTAYEALTQSCERLAFNFRALARFMMHAQELLGSISPDEKLDESHRVRAYLRAMDEAQPSLLLVAEIFVKLFAPEEVRD